MAFLLPLAVPFRLEAKARADLFEPWTKEAVYADWGEALVTLTAKCGRITGRVVSAESGDLLKIVALTSAVSTESLHWFSTQSLEGGRFDLLAPAGKVDLEAAAPGRERTAKPVSVAADEWVQGVEIALPLEPQALLSGRVVDDAGIAVAGARASLRAIVIQKVGGGTTLMNQDIGRVETDLEGKFVFSNLTPCGHLLSVSAEGFEPTGPIALEVAAEGAVLEVVLARAGHLLVRAVGPEGNVLGPARIVLRRGDGFALEAKQESWGLSLSRQRRNFRVHGAVPPTREVAETREGEAVPKLPNGCVAIPGVPPGEYEIVVEAPPLSGKMTVFVGIEGTTVAEVPCR
ncbi:MAG TPA: carboxypeptidase-like regulatory domain-containing protein [Planctomycetota bacterium]|nr:carboxypeptidase-like regulatory domain-containing protein [Planctomycetota bacterium]